MVDAAGGAEQGVRDWGGVCYYAETMRDKETDEERILRRGVSSWPVLLL